MSTEKTYLCDEYKLYFKIEDDVQILHNEVELYNTFIVGNNSFCHEEYIDGQESTYIFDSGHDYDESVYHQEDSQR